VIWPGSKPDATPTRAASPTSTRVHGRSQHRTARPAVAAAAVDAINAIASRATCRACWAPACVPIRDPLNATNFYTDNLFGVFVAQGLQDPNTNVASLMQGGLACRIASTTSPTTRKWSMHARRTRRTSPRC
jgi:hypothetical protein